MRVLSFGGGVQSTALLLASQDGLIPSFDLVIFADTHAEPKVVYDWINFVVYSTKIEIQFVSAGDIVADTLSNDKRFASAPFFVKNLEGNKGILRRQCTSEYKI